MILSSRLIVPLQNFVNEYPIVGFETDFWVSLVASDMDQEPKEANHGEQRCFQLLKETLADPRRISSARL